MLELTPCADERDEQVSLDVYNAVWPHAAFTMDEVRSFKQSVRAHHDVVGSRRGEVPGADLPLARRAHPEGPEGVTHVIPSESFE